MIGRADVEGSESHATGTLGYHKPIIPVVEVPTPLAEYSSDLKDRGTLLRVVCGVVCVVCCVCGAWWCVVWYCDVL